MCGNIHDGEIIQAAINASDKSHLSGRRIKIPSGIYLLRRPLLIQNETGLVLAGDAAASTILRASGAALVGKPAVLLINSSNIVVEGLSIEGDGQNVLSAGIESRVDNPKYDFALWPTGNVFRNLVIGSRKLSREGHRPKASFNDGLRFTASSGSDGNNDQSIIDGVCIYGFTHAAVSIEHSNSLLHRIINGVFAYGSIGVYVAGGSFEMTGTNLFVDDWDFDMGGLVGLY